MNPQLLSESDIDAELDAEIRKLLCACFKKDEQIFSKTRHWNNCSPSFSLILRDGDRIAAHVAVIDRTISAGLEQIRVAGIGNVCTLPDYRGRNLSGRLLATAMSEAEKRRFDCGLLFCAPELKKVYTRNGWIEISLDDHKFFAERNGSRIELPLSQAKMLYPLRRSELSAGIIDLRGGKW